MQLNAPSERSRHTFYPSSSLFYRSSYNQQREISITDWSRIILYSGKQHYHTGRAGMKWARRNPRNVSAIILWVPYTIFSESIPRTGTSQTNRAKSYHGTLKPQNHCPKIQKVPDGNIKNKCYPNPATPTTTTTITIDPTKLRTHQTNVTPNGNPPGDMIKHYNSK